MVRYDDIGMKLIRTASIMLENLLHQHCPPLMAEEWLPINGLGAHKVCLSAPPDVLSGRSHWFPQRLKPFNLLVVTDGLKPVPFQHGDQRPAESMFIPSTLPSFFGSPGRGSWSRGGR